MPLTIGPSAWWLKTRESANYYARCCPVGTTLPDGSKTICKNGVQAWIIAPASTQVCMAWASGTYNGIVACDKCCISEWSTLQNALIAGGFNPTDWFVPSCAQLLNPGAVCTSRWDSFSAVGGYWSSTEFSATYAYNVCLVNNFTIACPKGNLCLVRAFRCVTY